jgi:hypothetical protein
VGVSHRRLIELFTAEVGLTPKLFGRIQCFQQASVLTRENIAPKRSQLAAECGYFDQ